MVRRSSRRWKTYEVEGGDWAREQLGISQQGVIRIDARLIGEGPTWQYWWRAEVGGWYAPWDVPDDSEDSVQGWSWHAFSRPRPCVHFAVIH